MTVLRYQERACMHAVLLMGMCAVLLQFDARAAVNTYLDDPNPEVNEKVLAHARTHARTHAQGSPLSCSPSLSFECSDALVTQTRALYPPAEVLSAPRTLSSSLFFSLSLSLSVFLSVFTCLPARPPVCLRLWGASKDWFSRTGVSDLVSGCSRAACFDADPQSCNCTCNNLWNPLIVF